MNMLRSVVMMMGKVASSLTYSTWNPSDKHTSCTLSSGNLTASFSITGIVRSTIGKSSGKWYWEVTCGSVPQTLIGVADSSAFLNSYLGSDAGGWSYYAVDGSKYHSASTTAYGSTYTSGDVIGIALDMTAGTVTFYKNGTSLGTAYTGLFGTVYAAVSTSGSAGATTTNFGATAFTYSVPSGYNPGLY